MADAPRDNSKVSLQTYIERLMEEYKTAHAHEHKLLSEAVERTAKMLDIRLESMNEFRSQINSERGSFLRCEVYDIQHHSLEEKVNRLEQELSSLRGRIIGIGTAIAVMLLIFQILLKFLL